jgi:hypothetical protein
MGPSAAKTRMKNVKRLVQGNSMGQRLDWIALGKKIKVL